MTNYHRLINFLGFARSFLIRNNPVMLIKNGFVNTLKDFLSMSKKLKMAKYRVSYQQYKLQQMEQLIAKNNDHMFLRGNKINETR